MFKRILISVLLLLTGILQAQKFPIKGKISTSKTGEGLGFANVRVLGSTYGTAANIDGEFELKLTPGKYFLAASYIGYKSDTVVVDVKENIRIDIYLESVSIRLKEITVFPGINPAIDIIKHAVDTKKRRNERIKQYHFSAFTKGLIKSTQEISSSDNSVGLDIGISDTAELKITGIIENESRGFFKKPNYYKDEIVARKQSANFPSSINILTGGRIIQNFYEDDIQFFGRFMKSPISDDAVEFYYYILEDTLAYDNENVFQIYFEPDDRSDPGFYGRIYITDSTFNMIKLDVNLNDAANPGGIFSEINIFQQFVPYQDNIYMPIDYRLFVEGDYLGLVRFGFELSSVMYDYNINSQISDDFFDMAVLTVLSDADNRDSLYWGSITTIPYTLDEIEAYERIDSLESVPKTFWDKFSFLAANLSLSENISISGPLSLYHFNRVEGHSLNFGMSINNLSNKRINLATKFSYGFSDKLFKWKANGSVFLGGYRTHKISFSMFDDIQVLFSESDYYNLLTSTLTSIFGKYDFRDYYYSTGFDIDLDSEVLPIIKLGLGIKRRSESDAYVNSDFSLLNKEKNYNENHPIFETDFTLLKTRFAIDFRKYIEDGFFRRRTSLGRSYFLLGGEAMFSVDNKNGKKFHFDIYRLNLWSVINSFKSTVVNLRAKLIYSDGPVPYQHMYALPGNIQALGKDFSFRTLNFGEVVGDRVITFSIRYNLNDELFKGLKIPVLKDLQLRSGIHFNVAWSKISSESEALNKGNYFREFAPSKKSLTNDFIEFEKPFYELGFYIGHILIPMQLEFTWKLNYRGDNNFVIGLNTFAL
ncbi:DUF5686 family protein [Bacteroidota bacterium]